MSTNTRPTSAEDQMAPTVSALRRLMAWSSGMAWHDIPESVRRRAALILVDDLAAIIASRNEPEVMQLQDRMLRFSGVGEACVLNGRGVRADRHTAATANAIAGTWCELDEGYRVTMCHAGIYVLPALLAEAEAENASVIDVLRSLAVAYEITTRMARGFPGATRDLHPHGIFAVLGAAMGLGLLRAYAAEPLHATLNTACCMVTPSPFDNAYQGALVRNVWVGIGTANGMRAADWAPLGVTGLDTAPQKVFADTIGATAKPAAMTEDLGADWAVLSNFQKIHACCHFSHSTVDATLDLLAKLPEGRTVGDVEQIVVDIHPAGIHIDSVSPTTTLGARFSIPHIAAAAALLGHAGTSAFTMKSIAEPRIAALRERVQLRPFEPPPVPPKDRPARVTWQFSDGTERTAVCQSARGEPGHPYSETEILEKVASITGPVYPGLADKARALLDLEPAVLNSTWPSIVAGFGARRPGE